MLIFFSSSFQYVFNIIEYYLNVKIHPAYLSREKGSDGIYIDL